MHIWCTCTSRHALSLAEILPGPCRPCFGNPPSLRRIRSVRALPCARCGQWPCINATARAHPIPSGSDLDQLRHARIHTLRPASLQPIASVSLISLSGAVQRSRVLDLFPPCARFHCTRCPCNPCHSGRSRVFSQEPCM